MINLSKLKSPVIFRQTDRYSYRDPAIHYHEGVFYLYFTLVEQTDDEQYFYVGMSKSTDLIHWSNPTTLTKRDKSKEYSSPGNILEHNGMYYLCIQTYCRENGEVFGNGNSRIFTMATKDFENFEEPTLLLVKGKDIDVKDMGRMIDPYLIRDKDDPNKIWCFYKQNGMSYSYSYDMENWVYAGNVECGENVCVIVKDDEYLIFHSPENGIGLLSSKDLIHFKNCGITYLSQNRWNWAKDRITAGCVLDLINEPSVGVYLMFYHGDNEDDYVFGSSIAMAYSTDLKHFNSIEYDSPSYPQFGNIYEGDYYEDLPFTEYINNNQDIPTSEHENVFNIRDFGAVPDDNRLNTDSIMMAIEACNKAGGGTVLIEGGKYRTGTIFVCDNMTLHIAGGASLVGSIDYTRYSGALIVAKGVSNIKITGGGKIHGNGEYFVYEPQMKPLLEPLKLSSLPRRGVSIPDLPDYTLRYHYRRRIRYAEDKYFEGLPDIKRPSYMVWIKESKNVLIENIILEDSTAWTLNLDTSDHIVVKDVVINNNRHVANTDGIDITGSNDVVIEHCFVSTADDGIVAKNPVHTNRAMKKVHIRDCTVITVMNAFKIGTETRHDISDIFVEDCYFCMPDIYPGTVSGISIESSDGSRVSNVTVKNIKMDKVTCPLFICLNMRNRYNIPYSDNIESGYYGGTIKNVVIDGITAFDAEVPSLIFGLKATREDGFEVRNPLSNICVSNFNITYKDNIEVVNVPEVIEEYLYDYPENNSFGDVDAYGLWIRHVDGVKLTNINVTPRSMNTRECIKMLDVFE